MPPGWIKQLPGFRVYAALDEVNARLAAAKQQLKAARAEADGAKARADLASGTVTGMAAALQATEQPIPSHSRLEEILSTQRSQYRGAKPFPHMVIDDFVDPGILRTVVEEFDVTSRRSWHHTESSNERKFSTEDEQPFGPNTRALVHLLNAGPFLSFLEKLTGIDGLIADPHLRGGGLHEIKRGGKLGVHADFNFYKRLKVYRRLNVIIYLNADWRDEWGGHLELWEKNGDRPARKIAPIFNRAVIFDTSNSSYHGHPHPLECPEDRSRKSIALYYYSVDYPYQEDLTPHTTVFINTSESHEHEHEH